MNNIPMVLMPNISMVPVRTQKVPSCDNDFKYYNVCLNIMIRIVYNILRSNKY